MSETLRTVDQLIARGLAAESEHRELSQVAARFAVAVTPAMVDLIDRGDRLHDPIAKQFVPATDESVVTADELEDPIGDGAHAPVEGIVHRYPDRVLLKLTAVCAVYCRFCFRRELIGPGHAAILPDAAVAAALRYIADHPAIWEVVLTGGDPLAASARRLGEVSAALARIEHVKILRVHTRVPVVAPDLIDDAMLGALSRSGKTLYIAIHANHPRELSPAARGACRRLAATGAVLVSQSVLLRGVNDQVDTLRDLMRAFVEAGIKPYYLHHPDLAPGTSHFRLSLAEGQALVGALRGAISGLCQPHYVLDIPGGYGKVPVGPNYLVRDGAAIQVRDTKGGVHRYPDDLRTDDLRTDDLRTDDLRTDEGQADKTRVGAESADR